MSLKSELYINYKYIPYAWSPIDYTVTATVADASVNTEVDRIVGGPVLEFGMIRH